MTEELKERLSDFMVSFELVFDIDWDFTNSCLTCDYPEHFIAPGGTFLYPEIEDESNNSANRGSLLSSYRRLVAEMEKEGLCYSSNIE